MSNADKTIRDAAEAAEQAIQAARDYYGDYSPEVIAEAELALARFRGRFADVVGPRLQTSDELRSSLTRRIT